MPDVENFRFSPICHGKTSKISPLVFYFPAIVKAENSPHSNFSPLRILVILVTNMSSAYDTFQNKTEHFGPKKDHFRQTVPENDPPSSRMGTYRKSEGIQSYLRIWGSYDPIASGPSEDVMRGLFGHSEEKKQIFGPKMGESAVFWPKIHFFAT